METIVQGTKTIAFAYDSEHARIKQLNDADTTYYLNGAGVASEYRVTLTTETWVDYIFAGGTRIAVRKEKTEAQTTTTEVSYFVADHLGSIAVITDDQGTVTERLAYDAWGKRRELGGIDDLTNAITSAETRGFTGHEMLDDVSLVHMNGRIYDPALGRFLSADPVTQDWFDPQTLNRYSYVGNNPLSRTDPTGHFFKKLFKNIFRAIKKFIRPILAIAAAATLQFYLAPAVLGVESFGAIASGWVQAAITGVSGGIANVISSGNIGGFVNGFAQGALSFGIGEAFGHVAKFATSEYFTKIVAHGAVGGAFAEINGGKFGAGFLAAGFTSAAGPLYGNEFSVGNAVKAAIIGGAGSVLGGGKFENGAITASFTYLFNEAAMSTRERIVQGATGALQAAAGSLGVVAGVGSCVQTWGFGCLLAAVSASEAVQGFDKLAGAFQGRKTDGLNIGKELAVVLSPQHGELVYDLAAGLAYAGSLALPARLATPGNLRSLAKVGVWRNGAKILGIYVPPEVVGTGIIIQLGLHIAESSNNTYEKKWEWPN